MRKRRQQNDNQDDKKEEKEDDKKNNDADDNSKHKIESIQKRQDLFKEWIETLAEYLEESSNKKEADKVTVSQNLIEDINEDLDLSAEKSKRNSLGTFVQFMFEDEGTESSPIKGVVNSTFGGFGKMISRFLHLFDNDVKIN